MSQDELKEYNPSDLETVRTVGRGSYGQVDLLYDKKSKELVAKKVFSPTGNQEIIKEGIIEAQREIKLLTKLRHKHIVRILGIVEEKDKNIAIILEYAAGGDLERLLKRINRPIPWKIRCRFFAELADALNYLHHHRMNKSYIHGDLKSQNVLLTDALSIKLADFGAIKIAKLTGFTSTSIDNYKNTQHTTLYTAPEYLINPKKDVRCSMDVYSFGMVGYEILTRKEVFSGCNVPHGALLDLIKENGEKPNVEYIEVAKTLSRDSDESIIFETLKEIVYQCWKFEAKDRPSMSNVKESIDELKQTKPIYDKETEEIALDLGKSLKIELPDGYDHETITLDKSTFDTPKSKKLLLVHAISAPKFWISFMLPLVLGIVSYQIYHYMIIKEQITPGSLATLNKADLSQRDYSQELNMAGLGHVSQNTKDSCTILTLTQNKIIRYDIRNKSNTTLIRYVPQKATRSESKDLFEIRALKENDTAYVIVGNEPTSFPKLDVIYRVNLSDSTVQPSYQYKNENWGWRVIFNYQFIVVNDSIFAAGASCSLNQDCVGENWKEATYVAFLIQIKTHEIKRLPDLNERRIGNTLVLFQGRVCAVGGSGSSTIECLDESARKWIYLPRLKKARQNAAAVTLNDELYVIGGMTAKQEDRVYHTLHYYLNYIFSKEEISVENDLSLDSVEKYNSVTNRWTEMASLQIPRSIVVAGICQEKIYVVGDFSKAVEEYDKSSNEWKIVSNSSLANPAIFFTFA